MGGAFVSAVTHELRTPLNAIIGFSAMINEHVYGPIDNPHYDEYAHIINDSACHLLDIINDILDVSAIEAGKLMREHGGGAIVNTASVNALQPGPMQGIYSITKAAVVNMTKAFAKECAPLGIRCNALLPGLTKTKFAGALFTNDDIYQHVIQTIPMGRHAEPSEMAGTVLYLVSPASSFTNGECIVVDGGGTI